MFNESDTMVRRTILNDLAKKKRIFNSTKFFLFNYRKKIISLWKNRFSAPSLGFLRKLMPKIYPEWKKERAKNRL